MTMPVPRINLLAALALHGLVAGAAQPQPTAFAADFEGLKTLALVEARAVALARLQRSPTHAIYTLEATVRWAFLTRGFDDCSVVRFDGERMVPLEYVHGDHGEPGNDFRTEFDWSAGRAVTRLGNGETRSVDITWPTWDPMSFQLALMMRAASSSVQAGDIETHAVVERGAHKLHRVVFHGTGASQVGGPPVFAIRSEKAGGGVVTLLLDPARHYQPMRIGIEGVNLDFTAARPAPEPLADGEVPRCPVRRP